jgi:hypothetical protein
MVVGHFGIALGARALRRTAPLAWLVIAAIVPDLLDAAYALAKVCSPYGTWSHSLPAIALLAAIATLVVYTATRSGVTAAVFGLVVLTHAPADWLTGQKILWPHGPVIGLYLYRWPWLDFVLELPLIVAGWWMVRRSRTAPRWMLSLGALVTLLLVQAAADLSLETMSHFGTKLHERACAERPSGG